MKLTDGIKSMSNNVDCYVVYTTLSDMEEVALYDKFLLPGEFFITQENHMHFFEKEQEALDFCNGIYKGYAVCIVFYKGDWIHDNI